MPDLAKPPPPDPGRGWDPDDAPPPGYRYPAREPEPRPPADPVAVTAVGLGFLGIVFFGILMAIVVAILAAFAGQRAREERRSLELPYLTLLLAFIDGAVWLAMHYLVKAPIWIG